MSELPKPGDIVGKKYRVGARLGGGAMGVVYSAVNIGTSRKVALKWLVPELTGHPEAIARFRREGHAAGCIDHPNVAAVHDIFDDDGQLYLVMELLKGESLRDRLERGRMSAVEGCQVMLDVARGLAAAHSQGVLHRDIKPENIFLCDGGTAKVLDFGVAKFPSGAVQSFVSATGTLLGTYQYMAPEQMHAERDVDARADIYGLGVVGFEVLTGRLPYQADNLVDLALNLHRAETPRADEVEPSLPRGLADVLAKALSKDRDKRFTNAAQMAAALEPHTRATSSVVDEMEQALMGGVEPFRVAARSRRDRLHALALTVSEDAHRVDGERLPTAVVAEQLANLVEIGLQPLRRIVVDHTVHERGRSRAAQRRNSFSQRIHNRSK